MQARSYDVLVVGSGHGGAQVASSLMLAKFQGSVGLITLEDCLPYQRPPLTKGLLVGDVADEDLELRGADFWRHSGVDLLLSTEVTSVEPGAHTVTTADGGTIGYGTLVWAAGGVARSLTVPGGDLAGIHTLRTRSDAEALRAELSEVSTAVIVGGGYVGLESASSLVGAGVRVTLVETIDRLLSRVSGSVVADYVAARHRANGVDVRLGSAVAEIVGESGRAAGIRLTSGEVIPADMVIVGVGLVPAITPLADAGAEASNGIDVDEFCRTSLPDVYAIGDCANFACGYADGERVRLESVQNAVDQAKVVASAIVGSPQPYDSLPWFWSHQYDDKLQTAGLLSGHDEFVVRGDPATGQFSVVYLKAGRIIAVDAVNSIRDFAQGKKTIGKRVAVSREKLADIDFPLHQTVEVASVAGTGS
ncbi:NAD(P)/FAD-dependent oxidoreductase [Nocardioides sp. NPDC051685]|uniref:NAD(P)/FAD-dependent oxidoreductase n=1 Tax=Nocardioides sp. NPDC051685 TaxID=3364334 RepID=UPI0037BC6237